MTPEEAVASRLDRLHTALGELGKDLGLAPGASDDEIHTAEATMGLEFPPAYRALLRAHNGQRDQWDLPNFLGDRLLRLEQVLEAWKVFTSAKPKVTKDWLNEPARPPKVKHQFFNAKWIPIIGYGRNYTCIDLDPGPKGTLGQVFRRTDEEPRMAAPNLEALLDKVVERFEKAAAKKRPA